MAKKRHLSDLHVRGGVLPLDDGEGPVEVYVRKLNMTETELVHRRANAARARVHLLRRATDSDAYLDIVGEAYASGDAGELAAMLLRRTVVQRRAVREAELSADPEWDDDDYLQGLRDAWTGGLSDDYIVDPNDAEALRVYEELQRFSAEAERRAESDVEAERRELDSLDVAELQDRAAEELLRTAAEMAWLAAYKRACVWKATRVLETDHDGRPSGTKEYFANFEAVGELQGETFIKLWQFLDDLTVEPTEGKDSEGTPSSLPPSAPSDEEATERSSGPVAVAV